MVFTIAIIAPIKSILIISQKIERIFATTDPAMIIDGAGSSLPAPNSIFAVSPLTVSHCYGEIGSWILQIFKPLIRVAMHWRLPVGQ
jgi:hypothetical protein